MSQQYALIYHTRALQPKSTRIMEAVASGLRQHGWQTEMRESLDYPQGDENQASLLAVWGNHYRTLDIITDAKNSSFQFLHIDNGYLRKGHYDGYYSVTVNQTQANLWDGPPRSEMRWHALQEEIRPWQKSSKKILVLGQSHKQCLRLGLPYPLVNDEILKACRKYTSQTLLFHKKSLKSPLNIRAACRAGDIFVAVARTSKGLVEALLEGVPVVPTQPSICQGPMSTRIENINTPNYPSDELRQEFFVRLAWHQWTLDEIRRGDPIQFKDLA